VNRFAAAALFALCVALPLRAPAVDVLTYHNDNLRTGWNDGETSLTPSSIASGKLKPRFIRTLDGLAYAQPLVASAEQTANGTVDLVVVASDHDTVTALNARTGAVVWTRSLIPSGETIVTTTFTGCINMLHAGISGTPVIDRTRDLIYVVAETLSGGSQQHINFRLYALSLATGAVKGTPVVVAGQAKGAAGRITFEGDYQQQRTALVLANNRVYVGFGSTCDYNGNQYHGWLFAYDPDSLKALSTFMDTPVADENGNFMGGIWMSGNGLTVDANGNLLFVIGNGTFNGKTAFGDSVVKLRPDLSRVIDYFTPFTVKSDNDADADFGSGGLMLFPDIPGKPSVAFGQGKDGILTMMDQKQLGGFHPGGPDHVLGELTLGSTWSSPAYFGQEGDEEIFTTGGPLYDIRVTRSPARMRVIAQTNEQFPMNNGNGETPAISSNGKNRATAIVWIVSWQSDKTLQLLAYAAKDLSHPIFQAPLGPWQFHQTNSIQVPTIANGIVYVAGFQRLYAYSL
jgi:outer membrane protein assembly factor BamB